MADQKQPTAEEQKPKSKKQTFMVLAIVLLMVIMEGGTILVFKIMRKPTEASGQTDPIEQTQKDPGQDMAEISIVEDYRVDNYAAGRTRIVVTLSVSAKVKKENEPTLTTRIEESRTEILDRIRTIVASSQPESLREPKLTVIKREIKASLVETVGEGLVEEVLLPLWSSYSQY